MSASRNKINRALRSFKQVSGATHFLNIPLATSQSRPQLSSSLRSLARDPRAADIPREAFRWLDNIRLSLATVSLPTPFDQQLAIDLVRKTVQRFFLEDVHPLKKDSRNALKVRMQGLRDNENAIIPFDKQALKSLFASVIESTGRLASLKSAVKNCLEEAGLARTGNHLKFNPEAPETFQRATIVDTSKCTTNQRNVKPSLVAAGVQTHLLRRFDATPVYQHYGDHVWANEFSLEKIALCEMSLKNVVRDGMLLNQGYREVASIPFPGCSDIAGLPEGCDFFNVSKNGSLPPPYVMEAFTGQSKPQDFGKAHNFDKLGSGRTGPTSASASPGQSRREI